MQLASSRRTAARSAVSSRAASRSKIPATASVVRSSPARTCSDQRPLAGRRDHRLDRDREADLALAAEPAQAGGGEHDRVELALGELAQAGVDVAVQLLHPQVGAGGEQLGAAAQAGGADPGALGDVVERAAGADPDVGRVLARRHRGDLQLRRPSPPGRSLAECTPTSASPASSARSTPRTKRDLSPGSPSEDASTSSAPPSISATCPAWVSASVLPRVAIRIMGGPAPSGGVLPLRRSSVTLAPRPPPPARFSTSSPNSSRRALT